jgi:hypothetical protein
LTQIFLTPEAILNLPLKLCGMNQWIFPSLLQLLSQSTIPANNVRSEVFRAMTMMNAILWDVALCGSQ